MISTPDALETVSPDLKQCLLSEGRPVLLLTAEHAIAGNLITKDQRISEQLNDSDSNFVRLRDVGLFRTSEQERVTTLRECIVDKSQLELALILDHQHETPDKRRYRFVEKATIPVVLTVRGTEVRGDLQMPRIGETALDPVALLTHQTPHFFPVTNAVVTHAALSEPMEVPVAIVNTEAVGVFSVGRSTKAS